MKITPTPSRWAFFRAFGSSFNPLRGYPRLGFRVAMSISGCCQNWMAPSQRAFQHSCHLAFPLLFQKGAGLSPARLNASVFPPKRSAREIRSDAEHHRLVRLRWLCRGGPHCRAFSSSGGKNIECEVPHICFKSLALTTRRTFHKCRRHTGSLIARVCPDGGASAHPRRQRSYPPGACELRASHCRPKY